jgi:hypothetical protein
MGDYHPVWRRRFFKWQSAPMIANCVVTGT